MGEKGREWQRGELWEERGIKRQEGKYVYELMT